MNAPTFPFPDNFDKDTPLRLATGDLRDLLIHLAVQNEEAPGRPCCDGDTTLRDWIETGFFS